MSDFDHLMISIICYSFIRIHITLINEQESKLLENLHNNLDFLPKLLDDGVKRGFLMLENVMLTWFGHFKHTKLTQRIAFNHKGFLFRTNHFFFESFNQKIVQLVESGFAEKFVDEASQTSPKSEESGPVVLTLEHLGSAFKIVLLFLFISFVSFLLELLSYSALLSQYRTLLNLKWFFAGS